MKAKLDCRSCGGEGMVSAVYCDHTTKILRKSMRSCPKCEPHEVHLATPEVLVHGIEIEELVSKGYAFPLVFSERKVA